MATTFMACASATFDTKLWSSTGGAVTSDNTVFRIGPQSYSLSTGAGPTTAFLRKTTILADAGRRFSGWFRFASVTPSATIQVIAFQTAAVANVFTISLGTTGLLRIAPTGAAAVLGTHTLVPGTWYRIGVAYTIASSTSYEMRLFLNGVLEATISSNGTLTNTTSNTLTIQDVSTAGANFIINFDEILIDNGATLNDIAVSSGFSSVGVTAKQPATNNVNFFNTAIGANPANRWTNVNERPISETNGWGDNQASSVEESYGLQTANQGDWNITHLTLISRTAWIWAKQLVGVTGAPKLLDNGTTNAITLATTSALYTVTTDSTSYPSNAQGIGMMSAGSIVDATDFFECGTMIAFFENAQNYAIPEIHYAPPMPGSPFLVNVPVLESTTDLVILPPPPAPSSPTAPRMPAIFTGPPMPGAPWIRNVPPTDSVVINTTPPPPAIRFVQSNVAKFTLGDPQPRHCAFTNNVTKGDLLVVVASTFDGSAQTAGVTDTLGNAYTQINFGKRQFSCVAMWYAIAASSGANTVAVSTTITYASIGCLEYSGVQPTNSVNNVNNSENSTSTAWTTGVVETQPGDLVLGVFGQDQSSTTISFAPDINCTLRCSQPDGFNSNALYVLENLPAKGDFAITGTASLNFNEGAASLGVSFRFGVALLRDYAAEYNAGPPLRGAPWLQRLPIPEGSELVIRPPGPVPSQPTDPHEPPEIRSGPPMRGAPWLPILPIAEGSDLVIEPPPPPPSSPTAAEMPELLFGPPLRGAPWAKGEHLPYTPPVVIPPPPPPPPNTSQGLMPEVHFGPFMPGAPWFGVIPIVPFPPAYPPFVPPIPPSLPPKLHLLPRYFSHGNEADRRTRLQRFTELQSQITNSLIMQSLLVQEGVVDWTLGYTPADATSWASSPPTTIGAAFDRIAKLLKALNGGTGP